ncbi:hypothetical protein A1O3_07850 [Capronia epimyces CBS 606.96]|uniref:Uncharacterized protein n=1 Tax=Capronia epimyces CBS 606.96 TaxID=1182542 RepID=W9XRF4_9EURO|nr:uncharacterized protein A1O3_07850 [Capronia epimyces CBS 606.96]EXJ79571.1 hypothetical protein A1O3_07850 [Capronia epimyces CBS 606.96]
MTNVHKPQANSARCPISHKTQDPEDLERDFTTPGVEGRLGCPFAKMSDGLSPAPGQQDPIAAEFHQDKVSTGSPNTEQRPGPCPIRFLDQHSPEEVAQYFENHKHEIPRSHEICVRRYQQNGESARKLDAKYGSLVNMIQGLGVKHKAYLPERDRTEEQDKSSTHAVEKWAENVSSDQTPAVEEPTTTTDDEPRLSRFEQPFEQPLREIRVGESPSRPWGISVPAGNQPSPSVLQSEDGIPNMKARPESPQGEGNRRERKCPFDHTQAKASAPTPQPPDRGESKDIRREPTQIIFNGPVFFGYTAEQVTALLQNTTLGGGLPAAQS